MHFWYNNLLPYMIWYTYTYTFTWTYTHTHTYTYIHTYIHTWNAYIHTYIHTHIHTYTHTHIHTYTHTHIHTYTHTHIHTYTHTYRHTYIHTYMTCSRGTGSQSEWLASGTPVSRALAFNACKETCVTFVICHMSYLKMRYTVSVPKWKVYRKREPYFEGFNLHCA